MKEGNLNEKDRSCVGVCVCALLHYFKPFFFVATPPFFSLFIDLLSFTVNNLFENNKTFLLSKLVWLLKSHFEMCH